jgi:hypothetical protein
VIRLLVKALPILLLLYAFRSGTASALSLYDDVRDWVRSSFQRVDLHRLASALESEYAQGGRFPSDFGAFIEESMHKTGGDARLDEWGTPLMLRTQGPHYEIVSAGPDRTHMTLDDLVVEGRAERVN